MKSLLLLFLLLLLLLSVTHFLNAMLKSLLLVQVFSSMQSYDLGCSYGGGGNTAAVFNDAGLTFISHSETVKSQMRIGIGDGGNMGKSQ